MFLSSKSLERVDYAVKKVLLASEGAVSERSLRVLREVRIFARLDHVNIVRFYNAWLEFVPKAKLNRELGKSDKDLDSEESFVTQESSLETDLTATITTEITHQLATQDLSLLLSQEPTETESACSVFDDLDTTTINWKDELNRSGDCPFVFEDTNSLSQFDAKTPQQPSELSSDFPSPTASEATSLTPKQALLQSITTSLRQQPSIHAPLSHSLALSSRKLLRQNALVLYIQMAYCGKRTLNHYLQDPTRVVNEDEILNVCIQLCKALAYMHSKQVIHRDVKPANIFYTEDGSVRLGDFGLSRDLSEVEEGVCESENSSSSQLLSGASRTNATTTNIGTRIYSSPEQMSSFSHYDYKSDIYAAGVVLYEMSYPPFKTSFEKCEVLNQPRTGTMPETRAGISHALYSLIRRMLELDPAKRPSASEVVTEATMIQEKKRKLIIQLSEEESYNRWARAREMMCSQQLIISSQLQALELSKYIRLIMYNAKDYQIVVTLSEVEEGLLNRDVEAIRGFKGVISVHLTSM